MTKHEGMRAAMEAVGRDASRDVDAGMTDEQRALLMERLDGLPDVTITVNAEHIPGPAAVAVEGSVDVAAMVALAHAAGGSEPVAARLTVGSVAWALLQSWYTRLAMPTGPSLAGSMPTPAAVFGVPIVLDPGADPWSWQLTDRDGAEMAAGRITDQTL